MSGIVETDCWSLALCIIQAQHLELWYRVPLVKSLVKYGYPGTLTSES